MKHHICLALAAAGFALAASNTTAQSTTFTYQGFLTDGGAAANGAYDFEFRVFDAVSGGAQQGSTVVVDDLGLTNGLFTVALDFGSGPFDGSARWVEVAVRPGAGTGAYTSITPRQQCTSLPYAIRAANFSGAVTAAQLPSSVMTNGATNVTLSGTFTGSLTGQFASGPAGFGDVLTVMPTPLNLGQTGTAGDSWAVIQGDHYAATANGTNGIRIYDVIDPAHPLLVAQVNQGLYTRDVAGADGPFLFLACPTNGLRVFGVTNPATPVFLAQTNDGNFPVGVVAGNGYCYLAGSPVTYIYSVTNPAQPTRVGSITNGFSTPGLCLAGDRKLFYAGDNSLRIYSVTNGAVPVLLSSVAVSEASRVTVVGDLAFVACGTNGMRIYNISNPTNITFITTLVADGLIGRVAMAGNLCYVPKVGTGILVYDLTTPAAPVLVRVLNSGLNPTDIALGGAYGYVSEINVGLRVYGLGDVANFTAGSSSNSLIGQPVGVTISGGGAQTYVISMQGQSQSVGGPNRVGGDFGTIGGGLNNVISNGSLGAVISGGVLNRIGSNSLVAVIGGGFNNGIGDSSGNATIGGGDGNTIGTNAYAAVIAGGGKNSIGHNAQTSTIGGGNQNVVSSNAQYATIPGGNRNTAGANYTFAAGNNAKANHPGSFVWADSQFGDFGSTTNDQASFRVQGGVRFTSGAAAPNTTVSWVPGGASWSFTSDRQAKDRVEPVNPQSVLEKLARVPITEWSYIGYDQRHIGPMAQDFHAEFPFNKNDRVLNDADLHGVALAAIQGLNQKLTEELRRRDAENAELKSRLAAMENLLKSLAASSSLGGGQE